MARHVQKELLQGGTHLRIKSLIMIAALLMCATAMMSAGCGEQEAGIAGPDDSITTGSLAATANTVSVATVEREPGTIDEEVAGYAEAEVDIEGEGEVAAQAVEDDAAANPSEAQNHDTQRPDQVAPADSGEPLADFGIFKSFLSPNPVAAGEEMRATVVISGQASSVTVELRLGGQVAHAYPLVKQHQGNGSETWAWSGAAPPASVQSYEVYIATGGSRGESLVGYHGSLKVNAAIPVDRVLAPG